MPQRSPLRFLQILAATAFAVGSPFAEAFSLPNAQDPFDTALIEPPRPTLAAPAAPGFVPCQEPTATTVFGVVEVVDLALCRNPQTHEAWANARADAASVGIAQSAYLPTVDGKITTTRSRGNSVTTQQDTASLTLSWLIYDFGARSANLENARQLLSAASSTLDATVQTVFLNALQYYYNAQAARAAVTAALESERASRESLTAAEVRYQVGTGTPADRLQAQTAWSQATLDRIRAEGTLRNALGQLATVMGLDAGRPLQLVDIPQTAPDASFERDVDALIEQARTLRPDLKSAEAQVRAAQANVDYARAAGLPTLSLGTGPAWQRVRSGGDSVNSHDNAIGLTLTLPLFSGFETTYRVRSAQANAEAVSAQRDAVRLQVALDVWTAYQNLTTATQSIRTTDTLLASAEQSERVALGRYRAGVGSILDVLNAQSALAAARQQHIQARLDWNVSRAALAKAIGSLDGRLLDPAAKNPLP